MKLEEIRGGIFAAFYGAAYSVIFFGPLMLPLTLSKIENFNTLGLLCLALITLVVSLWILVRFSIVWLREREDSVEALIIDSVGFVEDVVKRRIGQIIVMGIFIFIIQQATIRSGILTVFQTGLWITGIISILIIQYVETLS